MALGTKTIQQRIKSVSNTIKITKAMEMVAAAKMKKAIRAVLSTRSYSHLTWQILAQIKQSGIKSHPLLRANKSLKRLILLISSDKGLCGGLNAQIFRKVKFFLTDSKDERIEYDFIIIGKKAAKFAGGEKLKILAVFENLTNNPKFVNIKPAAKIIMEKFIAGEYGRVYVAYTDYVSTLIQKPRVRQLLPIIKDKNLGEVFSNQLSAINSQQSPKESKLPTGQAAIDYLFEPQAQKLLKIIAPKILETQIYQAVLESISSEHSARMVAMKNATDAALEMVDNLKFTYNQMRQGSITREISEISAGKAALE